MTWFIMGLAKKVLIADRIAPLADLLFKQPHEAGLVTSWLGSLAYAMQLYFDFSGYSDMAMALARMFSIEFPLNFDSPYKARGISEFWQRWHMTLSRYLNEYLYTTSCALDQWPPHGSRQEGQSKSGSDTRGVFLRWSSSQRCGPWA